MRPTVTRFSAAFVTAALMAWSGFSTVGALAQSGEPAASPRVVQLSISGGVITPNLVSIQRGETITFEVHNAGPTDVEFIVGLRAELAADSGDSLREAEHISPGDSVTLTYTFDGDGPYAFGDHLGRQYRQGVRGVISLAPVAPRVVQIDIGAGVVTPASIEARQGETISFQARNVTDSEVELVVGRKADLAAGAGGSLMRTEHIAPGASATLPYTFHGPGPWGFGDQVGDHYARGAQGDIVIARDPSAVPRVVLLVITDDAIIPPEIQIEQGETVTFVGYNASKSDVELIVGLLAEVAADAGDSLKEAEHIAPGQSATLTYVFDGPGPWGFGDQMGDHYDRGVGGDIVLGP